MSDFKMLDGIMYSARNGTRVGSLIVKDAICSSHVNKRTNECHSEGVSKLFCDSKAAIH